MKPTPLISQQLARIFHGKHLGGAGLPGVGGRGRRPFKSADPGGREACGAVLKGKVAKETEVYKKGLLLVYGRGLRASSITLYTQGVLFLLTGIRLSHQWALGSSPAPRGARGRSPGELRGLPRDHFGSNFNPRRRL